eukprot:Skav235547  [mRNA]  locus=scaffold3067:235190:241325:+ [translate_table: standard]
MSSHPWLRCAPSSGSEDLGRQLAGVNMFCKAIGTGAFHAGVEVYQTEWSYGGSCNGPTGTGIFCCPPKGQLINKLKLEWKGQQYDLLRHNCCHFAAPMLAAQGMKALANLFQPDVREPETLDHPEPPAAAAAARGYPRDRRDAQGPAAGSRTLADVTACRSQLPLGSADFRRAEVPLESAAAKPTWSKAEETTYREEFNKLLPSGKSALDSDPLAEYLKTSGLPRKVLKQIWIASVKSATQADLEDFGCCCRLIAHCQIAFERADSATIEVMEQAGEQLRQLLREKFLDQPPSKMPEFGKAKLPG